MLPVMYRAMEPFIAHTASADLASGGSDQTISTEVPLAVSVAVKTDEGVANVPASNLRMSGLFNAFSEIHAASWRHPSV